MTDPEKMEQSISMMVALVKACYDKAIKVGFNDEQALEVSLGLTEIIISGAVNQ